jgi:hypothetical protein
MRQMPRSLAGMGLKQSHRTSAFPCEAGLGRPGPNQRCICPGPNAGAAGYASRPSRDPAPARLTLKAPQRRVREQRQLQQVHGATRVQLRGGRGATAAAAGTVLRRARHGRLVYLRATPGHAAHCRARVSLHTHVQRLPGCAKPLRLGARRGFAANPRLAPAPAGPRTAPAAACRPRATRPTASCTPRGRASAPEAARRESPCAPARAATRARCAGPPRRACRSPRTPGCGPPPAPACAGWAEALRGCAPRPTRPKRGSVCRPQPALQGRPKA